MDYHRIYRDFIRDRMGKPEPEGYVEVHHIHPRCLGGTDDPQNLIALTPEDHFRAHILLARMHPEVPGLRATPYFMLGISEARGLGSCYSRASRGTYGMARRWHAEAVSGENNHNFDPTIYHLRHTEQGDWHGTSSDFHAKLGIRNTGQFARLVAGAIKSIGGWHLPASNPAGLVGYAASSLSLRATKRDKTVFLWRHKDGREFRGTKHEFSQHSGISRQMAYNLTTQFAFSSDGWYIPDFNPDGLTGAERMTGDLCTRADLSSHRFSHDDGRVFVGTRREMEAAHGPFGRTLDSIINKSKTSAQGWMLDEVRSAGTQRRFLGQGLQHRFHHPERGEFTGTQREFAEMVKCSPGNVCCLIKGSQKSSKGWTYIGPANEPRRYTRHEDASV